MVALQVCCCRNILDLIALIAAFLWADQFKPVPETYMTSPYYNHGALVLSEGTTNLI